MKITLILVLGCLALGAPAVAQALTAEEILLLRQNGVSEATIQMMLRSELQARSSGDATEDAMGTATIVRPGGRPAIVYSTGGGTGNRDADEHLQEQRAWEMLRHIIVDTRRLDDRSHRPSGSGGIRQRTDPHPPQPRSP